ncbi:MAG: putative rane protein, partial [Modestobacter sp.]|nr:putative rane protein [Modestobacter sp.]
VGELATRDFIRGELSRLVPEDSDEDGGERKKKGAKKRREATGAEVTG